MLLRVIQEITSIIRVMEKIDMRNIQFVINLIS
jgi:hypothetical protein